MQIADELGQTCRPCPSTSGSSRAGLVTQTRIRQVRGAVAHFYKLAVRARIVAERA